MAAQVEAVLFDYGLVLTGPPLPEAWLGMQGVTEADEDTFAAAYWKHRLEYDRGSLTGDAYWLTVGAELDRKLSAEQVADLIVLDTRLWTQVNQPMADWALRLRAAGTRTGILSNLGDSMMHGVLAELPWMRGFDHLTFSHALGLVKPDRAIYDHASTGLGVSAGHILFVDDREENIDGALAAGLQAIRYREHASFEDEMRERGLAALWLNGRP